MAKRSRQRPGSGDLRPGRPAGGGTPPPTGDAGATRPSGGRPIGDTTRAGIAEPVTTSSTVRRRRPVRRTRERSFFDRYRTPLTFAAAAAGVLLIGFLLFQSSARGAYECATLMTPGPTEPPITPRPSAIPRPTQSIGPSPSAAPTGAASASPGASAAPGASGSPAAAGSPAPSGEASPGASASPDASASPGASASPPPDPTPRVGFTTADLGRSHVRDPSQTLNYAFCPPTSGDHYNASGLGPIPDEFYPKTQERSPGGWVHNLEHGYIVALYRCPTDEDCATDAELAQLQQFFNEAPNSPVAQACPRKVVVARFDGMSTRFAVLAWGRALLTDQFDLDTALTFAQQWMDHEAVPERGSC